MHVFEAVSIEGYSIILRLLWLYTTNPIIDQQARTQIYYKATKVEIMYLSRVVKKILKGNVVFIIIKVIKDNNK